MLEMFYYNVPKEQHPDIFKKIENQLLGFKALDFDYYADQLFKNSVFSSEEQLTFVLDNLNQFNLQKILKDPAYITITSFLEK